MLCGVKKAERTCIKHSSALPEMWLSVFSVIQQSVVGAPRHTVSHASKQVVMIALEEKFSLPQLLTHSYALTISCAGRYHFFFITSSPSEHFFSFWLRSRKYPEMLQAELVLFRFIRQQTKSASASLLLLTSEK